MSNIIPFVPTTCAVLYRRRDELTTRAQRDDLTDLQRAHLIAELRKTEIELRLLTLEQARQRKK